jgi:hypothetical protein
MGCYGLDDPGFNSRHGHDFSVLQDVQTGSGADQWVPEVLSLGGKVAGA